MVNQGNSANPAWRAFSDWEYKIVKKTRHPYVVCRHLSGGLLPILYVAIGNRIKNISTAGVRFCHYGSIDISLEDMIEMVEVVKHARELYKES